MNQLRVSDPVEEQDIAASTDRRDGDRYRTVWRIAKVIRNGDAGLWRVRNISDRGMLLAADVPIAGGEKLEIALSATVVIRGEVVWSHAGRCGVSFDQEVDVADVPKHFAGEQRGTGHPQPGTTGHTKAAAGTGEGTA